MDVRIKNNNGACMLSINGKELERVKGYNITSSANGSTELVVTFSFNNSEISISTESKTTTNNFG